MSATGDPCAQLEELRKINLRLIMELNEARQRIEYLERLVAKLEMLMAE
jgi:hypothetical protein